MNPHFPPWQALAEATGQILWATDADGRLLEPSPSWRAFTGLDEAADWRDAIHDEDRTAVTVSAGELSCRVRRPGGRFTRTRLRAVPVAGAWLWSASEVWLDESVRRSEERLRLATEAAQVAVWEYDFVAGQMTRTDNHDALYGFATLPVWQYDVFTSATHPEDRPVADATVQAACAPGGPDRYACDFRVIWPDGSVHWLAVSGHVVARDADGRATLVRGALIDVTRLKAVEAELRQAIQARDEFMQIASHELNTPLTPLLLKLENLRGQAVAGALALEQLPAQLDIALRQVRRLATLVSDLLDVTRLSLGRLALSPAELSLVALVRGVVEELGPEAQRAGSELRLQVDGEVVGVWDRGRLAQVIENLVGNALKFGRGQPVEIRVGGQGHRARVEVRDHGPGIPAELRARIFDKFQRGGEQRPGLGLGLYIVKQIVELHGGTIAVDSEPGRGTSFVIELPRS